MPQNQVEFLPGGSDEAFAGNVAVRNGCWQHAFHIAACATLIYLFGATLFSGSVDFAHVYALVFELMENGDQRIGAPHTAMMASYPLGSHWIGALLGHLIGSGLFAVCIITILSVYAVCYCILHCQRDPVRALMVVCLFAAATLTKGVVGYEVVGNFFYSQLLGFAIYSLLLVMLMRPRRFLLPIEAASVILVAALLQFVHAIPSLNLLGAYGCFLLLQFCLEALRLRRLNWRLLAVMLVFGVAGLASIIFHPAVAGMRQISAHDGSLDFDVGLPVIVVLSLCVLAFYVAMLIGRGIREEPDRIDLVLCSALLASIALLFAQWLALRFMHNGSPYAVKKHVFVVLTLACAAFPRAVPDFWARLRPLRAAKAGHVGISVGLALAMCIFVFWRPGVASLYVVNHQVQYARDAVRSGFPAFRSGNTAVISESISRMFSYMIASSVFELPPPVSVDLLLGAGGPLNVDYAMVDRNAVTARCEERYAESSLFVIIPRRCLSRVPPDGGILFHGGQGGVSFLGQGWSQPESWGTWSEGARSVITM